jgi:hypothetical protein
MMDTVAVLYTWFTTFEAENKNKALLKHIAKELSFKLFKVYNNFSMILFSFTQKDKYYN